MPGPRPPEDTDLSAGPAEVDQEMEREGVTEEQLAKSNEPDFAAALDARQTAKEHSATAPAEYRAQEQEVLAKGRDEAEQVEGNQLAGMQGSKVAALAKVVGHKGEAKSQDEAKRAKVAADIQAIYDKTKTEVTGILTGLDGKVDSAFTSGEEAARKQFEDYVGAKMDAYKDDRYSGFFGGARWLKDKLFGMPDEVNVFYSQGRTGYLAAMDTVIGQVADIVGGELNAARLRIAQGRAEVRDYVTQLPTDLQKVGKDAEQKLDDQFDQLSSDVDNKQDALVDTLAQKYVQSRDALDSRIDELKAANRGLVAKALDAVVGVVKTILKLKDMLLNVLSKAADVIGDIITDPIGFLGRLVDGVKSGLTRFVDNIATHLQEGLMGWLFGALGEAGIQMPKTFDLAGIFELVMDVLGLTYRSIRGKVAKLLGEPIVEKMEQTVDVFKTLATKGVAGLWEWIKDKVGDFQEMVLGGIKNFIIERVIKGGITWLLSLLNPAAAFIKACKAIYDIVMFIVERGQAIMEFVNSILDSIGAIARGQIGIVADKVEGALAKALPLAISFLASLLGLGGISEKIREGIETVRKPIEKAVDFVVMGAVKGFRKLFGGAIGWVKGKYEKGKALVKDKATAAKDWGAGKVKGDQGPPHRARTTSPRSGTARIRRPPRRQGASEAVAREATDELMSLRERARPRHRGASRQRVAETSQHGDGAEGADQHAPRLRRGRARTRRTDIRVEFEVVIAARARPAPAGKDEAQGRPAEQDAQAAGWPTSPDHTTATFKDEPDDVETRDFGKHDVAQTTEPAEPCDLLDHDSGGPGSSRHDAIPRAAAPARPARRDRKRAPRARHARHRCRSSTTSGRAIASERQGRRRARQDRGASRASTGTSQTQRQPRRAPTTRLWVDELSSTEGGTRTSGRRHRARARPFTRRGDVQPLRGIHEARSSEPGHRFAGKLVDEDVLTEAKPPAGRLAIGDASTCLAAIKGWTSPAWRRQDRRRALQIAHLRVGAHGTRSVLLSRPAPRLGAWPRSDM